MNIEKERWKQVERLNGAIETWWHYNRPTVCFFLLVILVLVWMINGEIDRRALAESDARLIAMESKKESFICYTHDRATSITIAGGSHEQVYDALRGVETEAATVRTAILIAKDRSQKGK